MYSSMHEKRVAQEENEKYRGSSMRALRLKAKVLSPEEKQEAIKNTLKRIK